MVEEFDGNSPIYLQIMDLIKKQMISMELKPGERLPSVRDKAKQLEVNPNTVQRAYLDLEREKLVYTKRGQGTFIVDEPEIVMKLRQEMVHEKVTKFVKEMEAFSISRNDLLKIIEKHISG